MALEFFSSLFASTGVGTEPYHLRGLFSVLDAGTLQALNRVVMDDEIKEVRFWHDPWVSPGSVLADHLLPGSRIVDDTVTVSAVRVLAPGSVPDRLCWGLTPSKKFKRGLRMQQEAVAASVRGAVGAGCIPAGAAVSWTRPPVGWHKLNSDGALDSRNGIVSCGGLIRDDRGSWLIGFSKRIGICSILEAELWGIYEGLFAAWSIGSRYLLVESDCLEAINLINNRSNSEGTISMVYSISEVLNRSWYLSPPVNISVLLQQDDAV
ncbi:hypothetical protein V6N12_003397 [Hibiscus sabdariffa]|uniref:RNase H type-1 domain-containing protein n=1 Tax=Hibiscus sabdariffa TaxID=183260 RepID=A0ABR2B5C0_9ROSI